MRLLTWFKRRFRLHKRVADPDVKPVLGESSLREFVYLDEVSLRSLLSSQTGEMTESTSEQSMDAMQAQLSATLGANPGFVAKAELASRFQTSNSSTIQTSRKATVQSWFREFHDIRELRLIEPTTPSSAVADIQELTAITDTSLVTRASELRRGSLVEFKVKLKADPVYHLGTMMSEFFAMAEDYPDMFATRSDLEALRQAQPVNKVLQRLLAGLIPIRAEAVDYSVVKLDGIEYVAHRKLLEGHKSCPLEIVGVTEHLAYWKDIRRVLFSDAEFTLMGRIARDSLNDTWTPVKLADLFREVAPNLVDQINSASRAPFGTGQLVAPASSPELQLAAALTEYAESLVTESMKELTKADRETLSTRITELQTRSSSVSHQRSAFRVVKNLLSVLAGAEVEPKRDLELREAARAEAGLPIFPALGPMDRIGIVPVNTELADHTTSTRLLDVEVIAIYW